MFSSWYQQYTPYESIEPQVEWVKVEKSRGGDKIEEDAATEALSTKDDKEVMETLLNLLQKQDSGYGESICSEEDAKIDLDDEEYDNFQEEYDDRPFSDQVIFGFICICLRYTQNVKIKKSYHKII